jgi:hypothetical protein
MSSTRTHLNIGTGHVLAYCNAPLILLVQDELNVISCSCIVRAGLRACVHAYVDVCIKIAFGDDLTGFIGRNKFITLHIYNDAGKSAYKHKYGNCMSLMWLSHLLTRAVLRNAHGYKRTHACTRIQARNAHGYKRYSDAHILARTTSAQVLTCCRFRWLGKVFFSVDIFWCMCYDSCRVHGRKDEG